MKIYGIVKNTYMNKKTKTGIKNKTMKMCKATFCNEGCKGTIFEKGKKFPQLNKNIEEHYKNKKGAIIIRKELFKDKTDILTDNVPDGIPKRVSNNYKKQGAMSVCDIYVPHGTLDLISEKINE